jgi:hypothetical protein
MKSSVSLADWDKIESAWLQCWKNKLGNPSHLPRKVMRAYLEDMDITTDVLDDQMNCECWPVNDEVEDFKFAVEDGAAEGF